MKIQIQTMMLNEIQLGKMMFTFIVSTSGETEYLSGPNNFVKMSTTILNPSHQR